MQHPVLNQKTVRSKSNNKTLIATTLSLAITALAPHANALTATERQLLEQVRILSAKIDALEKKSAQPATAENRALDQKVRILERKIELADEDAAKKKLETPIVIASDKGFGFKSADADKSFELRFRGLTQADARLFEHGSQRGQDATRNAKDDFLMRRVRPTLEGTFFKNYDFKITYDFGNNQSQLIDAYIDSKLADKAAVLRVGKFTPALGLEHIQGSSSLKFNENSLPSNFTPSRDIGLQLGGKVFSETVEYAVGVFNGALDGSNGDRDINTDKELAARIFFQPLANSPGLFQNLGFGVAASFGNADGRIGETSLPTYRTAGQETFYSYRGETTTTRANLSTGVVSSSVTASTFANGNHDRLIPQFTWYTGGFGLLGEFANIEQGVKRINGATTREDTLDQEAWAITASYLLTGEEASFKGVKPNSGLEQGGIGAWELIARVGALEIDEDAFTLNGALTSSSNTFANPSSSAQKAESWAVGVNWYPNSILRASLNYENTSFDWGGGGTSLNPLDRDDEKVLIGRLQAAF